MRKKQNSWQRRQANDIYVQAAKKQGYRSRASFKLLEIQKKDQILKSGMQLLDLGAAPGGWSQVASQIIGKDKIIAVDLLPMQHISGVNFIQGDFTDASTQAAIRQAINGVRVDFILSDMAPNLSGVRSSDQAKVMYLAELVLHMCAEFLQERGGILVKVFQGEGFDEYLRSLRQNFTKVLVRKPQSSRKESKEQYLLALGYKVKQKGVSSE